MIGLQDFQDDVMLHTARDLLRDVLERNVSFFVHLVGNMQRFLFRGRIAVAMKSFLRAEDHVARHAILELADVPRPLALLQQLQRFARDRRSFALETAVEKLPEIVHQVRNVVAAVAQGRQRDGDHVDAVKKISAKAATRDFLMQQAIGGADDARVHAPFLLVADAREMTILQDVQQLCLQAGIDLRNFV